jgi:small subunit ribosomal protein S8
MMTDPIADMLTRIRNGLSAKHSSVEMPLSKMKLEIAKIMKNEGFVKNYKVNQDDKQGMLKVMLKYDENETSAICEVKRVSKPGRRVYTDVDSIPKIKNGLGVAVISTSKGILTDKQARNENVGGEVLCYIW